MNKNIRSTSKNSLRATSPDHSHRALSETLNLYLLKRTASALGTFTNLSKELRKCQSVLFKTSQISVKNNAVCK